MTPPLPNDLLLPLVAVAAVALYALAAVWLERKVAARVQDRIGPNTVGPHGSLQTLADIVKMLQKEAILPTKASAWPFRLAPAVAFALVFLGFAALPFGPGWQGASLQVGLLFVLAVVALEVAAVLLAGWSSGNKFGLLGSVRAVAQTVAYEVPLGLALLAVVVVLGSLNLADVATQQSPLGGSHHLWGLWETGHLGGLLNWNLIRHPVLLPALAVFLVAALAESHRAPFDLPEAESELVAGYHTEYSGLRFALFMLAEYASLLLMALLAVVLFLGAWASPLPNLGGLPAGVPAQQLSWTELLAHGQLAWATTGTPGSASGLAWGLFWLLTKASLLVLGAMWVRWSFPRLRADQLLALCWKYLTPLALGSVVLAVLWRLMTD